ncbi:MAG: winged helix-turn-helix transcriptional regulator [Bacteroidales bacterium]
MLNEILNALKSKQGNVIIGTNNGTNDDVEITILNFIRNNKEVTLDELSVLVNKSRRTIARIMNRLQNDNKLRRIGSTRSGYWEIV